MDGVDIWVQNGLGHAVVPAGRPGLADDFLNFQARAQRNQLVRRLGNRLGQEGYRGFFEVDVLVDLDSDEVYLGELNPRISGASAITNVTAGAYADVPLFLFHLLEFMGVEFFLLAKGKRGPGESLIESSTATCVALP